ncbi:glycoside hydrolase family 24 protein [Myxosarcina sp. GI1(2024)]
MQPKTQKINFTSKIVWTICALLILFGLRNFSVQQIRDTLDNSADLISKIGNVERSRSPYTPQDYPPRLYGTQPLVMEGGDPYIRALMRTITASESNVARPYNVIYGGQLVEDLSEHPEICVPIVAGPNVGKCSTAAGRYQMLDFTWENQAKRYHPRPSGLWWWRSFSFAAEYQDVVVHDWLSDRRAWNADIPQLLRQGKTYRVLRLLSGTWTSLGYGIETNSMSQYLPQIYQNMLREELNSNT